MLLGRVLVQVDHGEDGVQLDVEKLAQSVHQLLNIGV
jgi:hypothetical protein